MPFNRPTLQQIINRMSADIIAKITGATTLALRSVLLILGRIFAGAVHSLYGYLDNQSREIFATTATGDADGGKLDTIGGELGVVRRAASFAVGSATFTGTVGATIPAGTALVSSSSNRYLTDAITSIPIAGSISIALTCDTAGVIGNDSPGISISLESSIIGVNSTAVVDSGGFTGGADIETDDAYRERILARKRRAPHGGAAYDLEQWALEVPGVTRAWAVPQYNGVGTVALYFVCDAQSPISPSAAQIADVLAYLISHIDSSGQTVGVPVTMLPGLYVGSPSLVSLNMTIKLYPNNIEVQTDVITQLTDLLLNEGTPGSTLYLSRLQEAISTAAGEEHSLIISPITDPGFAYNQLPVLGTITWMDY